MSEVQKNYDGVMAVITDRSMIDVLLVQELTRSVRTGKDIGDYAFPAESREPHETNPLETAARIFEEEIKVLDAEFRSFLCSVDINELTVGVMHFVADPRHKVSIGTAQHEVANPMWVPIDEVRTGSINVRQGVREVMNAINDQTLNKETVIRTSPRFLKKNLSNPRT